MARLTFPVQPDGLLLPGLVNWQASALLALRASGSSRPPIPARAQIDTGTNISGVAISILQQLNIPVESRGLTTGIGGALLVDLYRVSLHLWDDQKPTSPWFTLPSLLVMGLHTGFPIDVLVGMDVLTWLTTSVDGPGGTFTLDF